MKYRLLIILLLSFNLLSATERSDSLEVLLEKESLSKSKKIEIRLDLLLEYRNILPEKGIDFAKGGLKNLPNSKDSVIYKLRIFNGVGDSYRLTSQNELAMDYYFKALRLSEKIGDTFWRATALNNIALVYNNIMDLELSLDYIQRSLNLFKSTKDTSMLIQSYNNLASIYWNMKKVDSASKYFTYAFELSKNKNDLLGLLQSYNNLGIVLLEKKEFYESLEYFSRALEISRDLNDQSRRAKTLNNLGRVFIGLERYNSAEMNLEEALGIASQINAKAITADSYYYLSELYKQTNNFKKALEYSELYNNIKDSLYNNEKNRRIQKLQEEYRVSKKDAEIKILKQREEILSQREYYTTVISIISAILFILIITFLTIRYRSNKKSNQILTNLNLELDKKNKDLNELNATKDKIFNIVAHDLKNPLSGFRNITSVLLDYYNDMEEDEILSSLSQIRESSNNLLLLLENLLVWARLQKDEVDCHPEKIAINHIVDKYLEHYKEKFDDKKLEVTFNHNNMDVFAYCDVNLISIVIKNLISNSIKYSKPHRRINIELSNIDDKALFSIVDNGVGIQEEKLESIFQIGNNSSTFGTDGERGTGLGLILSKSFLEMNDGNIWIESEVDQGTKVNFELPAKP